MSIPRFVRLARIVVFATAAFIAATFGVGVFPASAQDAPVIVDVTFNSVPFDYRPPAELGVDSTPAVAQGSIFKIWGRELGPVPGVSAASAALPFTLADIRAELLSADGVTRDLPLYWVGRAQINAVLPSDAPIGLAHLRVDSGGATSPPFAIKIVRTRPRIFDWRDRQSPRTVALLPVAQVAVPDGSRRFVTQVKPARPGDTIVLWANGLGPRTAPSDDQPFPEQLTTPLTVYLADQAVEVDWAGRSGCCAAVDQVQFRIPENVALGCYVPLTLRAFGGIVSELELLPITSDGEACGDIPKPGAPIAQGFISFDRTVGEAGSTDLFSASFRDGSSIAGRESLPGLCLPQSLSGSFAFALDSGSPLTVETPARTLEVEGTLGGFRLSTSSPEVDPFLGPGRYSVTAPAGDDIGAFNATLDVPAPPEPLLDDLPASLAPDDAVTVSWSGDTAVDHVRIEDRVSFFYVDRFFRADGVRVGNSATICRPAPGETSVTFPSWSTRRWTWAPADGELGEGAAIRNDVVITLVSRTQDSFEAEGIDIGTIVYRHNTEIAIPFAGPFLPVTPLTTPLGDVILAELAVTEFELQRGLAGRPRLPSGRGLLLQFPSEQPAVFPTIDLPEALDLLWLNSAGVVLGDPVEVALCEAECAPINGPAGAQWALAVASGEAARLGLAVGSRISW